MAVAVAVAVSFAACSDDGEDNAAPDVEETADDQTETGGPTSTSAPATSVPGASKQEEAESAGDAPLEDGRHFGYIEAVHADDEEIEFDLAQFLTGDEADVAAQEDGVVGPGEEIENDYYIRNVNPKLRTLTVDAGVEILLVDMNSSDVATPSREVTLEELGDEDLEMFGFWVTVEDAVVTGIAQQFVP